MSHHYQSNSENMNNLNYDSRKYNSSRNVKKKTSKKSSKNQSPLSSNFKTKRPGSNKPNPIGMSKRPKNKNEKKSKSPLHTRFGESEGAKAPITSPNNNFFGKNSGLQMEYEPNFYQKHSKENVNHMKKAKNLNSRKKSKRMSREKNPNEQPQKPGNLKNPLVGYNTLERKMSEKRVSYQQKPIQVNNQNMLTPQNHNREIVQGTREITFHGDNKPIQEYIQQNIQQYAGNYPHQGDLLSTKFKRKPFKPKHPFLKKYFNEDGSVNFNELSKADISTVSNNNNTPNKRASFQGRRSEFEAVNLEVPESSPNLDKRGIRKIDIKDSPFKNNKGEKLRTFERRKLIGREDLSGSSQSPMPYSRSTSPVYIQNGMGNPIPGKIVRRRIINSSIGSNSGFIQQIQQDHLVQTINKDGRISAGIGHSRQPSLSINRDNNHPGSVIRQSPIGQSTIKKSGDVQKSPSKLEKIEKSKQKIQSLLQNSYSKSPVQNITQKITPAPQQKPNPLLKTIQNQTYESSQLRTIEEDKQNEKTCSSQKLKERSPKTSKTVKIDDIKSVDDESESSKYSESSEEDFTEEEEKEVERDTQKTKLLNTDEYFATAKSHSSVSNPLKKQSISPEEKIVEDQTTEDFRLTKNTWGKACSNNQSMKNSKTQSQKRLINLQQNIPKNSISRKDPTYASSTSNISPSQYTSIITPTLQSTSKYSSPYAGTISGMNSTSIKKQKMGNSLVNNRNNDQNLNEFNPHGSVQEQRVIKLQEVDNSKNSLIDMRFVGSKQHSMMQKKPKFNVDINNGEIEPNVFKVDETQSFYNQELEKQENLIRELHIQNQRLLEENQGLSCNLEEVRRNHQEYIKEIELQESENLEKINEEYKQRIGDLEKIILGLRKDKEYLEKKKLKEKKKRKKIKTELELEIQTREDIIIQNKKEISSLQYTIKLLTLELQNSENDKENDSSVSTEKVREEVIEELEDQKNKVKVLEKKNRKLKKELRNVRKESISKEDYCKSERAFEELQKKVVALVKENNRLNSMINNAAIDPQNFGFN